MVKLLEIADFGAAESMHFCRIWLLRDSTTTYYANQWACERHHETLVGKGPLHREGQS
jgi:hypothetical protein